MDKAVVKLGIMLGIVVVFGVIATNILFAFPDDLCPTGHYCSWGWMTLTVTLVSSVVICFFGILSLPGGRDEKGGFREERIRLSIVATLMVVYFVLFSNAVLYGRDDTSINKDMLNTLTQLMTIVLPFYFGTSGLIEWAKRKEGKTDS